MGLAVSWGEGGFECLDGAGFGVEDKRNLLGDGHDRGNRVCFFLVGGRC